ncbi:MAG: hypothetical protein KBT00_08515 [Bacteroidales bacterium]|nr:hypothetical protein [Candidatus Cacconaster merdequi]
MTAIVGILNKKAAVMAADSALTVLRGDHTRIYNNATKIFRLSDNQPVGAMIFSCDSFMGVPLTVLFNMYREKYGNQPFPTLQEYVDNFISFLAKEPHFADAELQHRYLRGEIGIYYDKVKDYTAESIKDELNTEDGHPVSDEERIRIKRSKMKEGMLAITDTMEGLDDLKKKSPEFEKYSFKKFLSFAKEDIDGLKELCEEDDLPSDMGDDWAKGIYDYLCSQFYYDGTGIVFVGYGTEELFPSLIPIYVSGIVDGRLRYCYSRDEEEHISWDNESAICPFAQCDVMMTVMKGISPALRGKVDETANDAISQTKEKMIEAMREAGVDALTIAKVQETDLKEISDRHEEQIQNFIQTEYINGLVDTVESFGVEDMANMAESLISITNLQRHFTASEESVGGPVDVAVITKSDGFVWLKHKSA